MSVRLTQRCCGTLFNGTVRVPEEAATGKAKVTLGFPVWSLGGVSRGTGEVTVEDPPPEKK